MKPHRCCTHNRGQDMMTGSGITILFFGLYLWGCVGFPTW